MNKSFIKKRSVFINGKRNGRWRIPHFMSILDYIEYCGKVGMSRNVGIYADGDGYFHPKFKTNIKWEKQKLKIDSDGDRLYDAG